MSQGEDQMDGSWWLGIDVGGTFTDLVAVDQRTGERREQKVLTTKDALERGVMQALDEINIDLENVAEIVHGHTAGINAILSREGAKTALVATAGHRDLLDIGRMEREYGPSFYDPTWLRPHQQRPIIERRNRYGVLERLGPDGTEIFPLDKDQLKEVTKELKADGCTAVAVCFVNAYRSQEHEQQAAEIIRAECPDMYVQTSAVYPVTKESERTVTVALDAYTGPIVTAYLRRLSDELAQSGFSGSLWIMMMNGGVGTVQETSKAPVFQIQSGPVGGVNGGVHAARTTNQPNLLGVDVGGTSSDVSVIRQGDVPFTDIWSTEHGLTLTMPVIDVRSVGSGAGSIIGIDSLGTLSVGPESAGSTPGPACYGRGGEKPTLTDACLVLGYLQPDLFAGGALTLNHALAEQALSHVAESLTMSVLELAGGAYELACSDIAGSIRSISTYRGLDVREFSLLGFGAAGPMVANKVARELGTKSVIIPPSPGEFSAFGLLESDLKITKAASPVAPLSSFDCDSLEAQFKKLEDDVSASLAQQGMAATEEFVYERAIFAMYQGQTWDNRIALESGPVDADRLEKMPARIHDVYRSRYGYSAEELGIIITTLEVTGIARRPELPQVRAEVADGDQVIRSTSVQIDGVTHSDVPVYRRDRLPAGTSVSGPALVVEAYATTVVDARSQASVDESGNLHIALT